MSQLAVAIRDNGRHQFPFLDLKAQFACIREELLAAVQETLEEQHFILGPQVEQFEQEVGKYLGTPFAISCASGSDALLLALMALNVQPGDEVITSPFTFGATGGSIARLRATPVFVDIDPATYNLDPNRLESAITSRTRAILPVHLFGLSADMGAILAIAERHGIPVIEDAAQAIGAKYKGVSVGTLGAFGCFSFFPSKNLGCAGDGGLIVTNDAKAAETVRMLRVHGCKRKYHYEIVGINSRLDAIQAAILRVKLRYLQSWTAARRANAALYNTRIVELGLQNMIELPQSPEGYFHVFNQYVICAQERDKLRGHLEGVGIPTEVYYPLPLHLHPAFAYLGHSKGDFPKSEAASLEALALPIFAEMSREQQVLVLDAMAQFYFKQSLQEPEALEFEGLQR